MIERAKPFWDARAAFCSTADGWLAQANPYWLASAVNRRRRGTVGTRRNGGFGSRVNRRQMLRGAAAGVSGLALWTAGCSSSSSNNNNNVAKSNTASSNSAAATHAPSVTAATPAATRAATAAASAASTAAAGTPTAKVADFGFTNNAPNLTLTPKKGGTFHYSTHVTAPGLDPVKSASYESANVYTQVYNRLVRGQYGTELQPYNPWRLKVTGDLAESWEQPDAQTFVLKLRPNVKFQNVAPVNGRAFTSADAKYSFDAFLANPDTASQLPFTVETPDPMTVKLNLPKPANYVLQAIQDPRFVMLAHEVAEADGDFSKRAIGTGPFILDNYVPNTTAHYKRNPDYYRSDRPYLDAIQQDNFKDSASSKAAFISGQYEYAEYALQSPDDVKDILSSQKNTVVLRLQSRWQSNVFAIGFPFDVKPWSDQRVRTGISKGFDRSVFGKSAYNNDYNVLGAYAWIDEFNAPPDLGDAYKYDPKAAKQMLQAAGITGTLDMPFEYFTYGGDAADQLQAIQQQLKDIGVNLQLKNLDYTTFFAKYYGKKADGPILSFIPTAPRWAPLSMLALWHTGAPKNYLRINDPAFDAAVDKLTTTANADEQKSAYQDAFNKLQQPAYFISIAEAPTYFVHAPKLHGLLPNMYNDPAGWGNQAMEDFWLDA